MNCSNYLILFSVFVCAASVLSAQDFSVRIIKPAAGDTVSCCGTFRMQYGLRSNISSSRYHYYIRYGGDADWTDISVLNVSDTEGRFRDDLTTDVISVRCDRATFQLGIRENGGAQWLATTSMIAIGAQCDTCSFRGPVHICGSGGARAAIRALSPTILLAFVQRCLTRSADAGATWGSPFDVGRPGGASGEVGDLVVNAEGTAAYAFGDKFLFRTTDAGLTWVQRPGINNDDDYLDGAAGRDGDVVIAEYPRSYTSSRVIASRDGFATRSSATTVPGWANRVAYRPGTARTFFICGYYIGDTESGARMWRSDDGGATWTEVLSARQPGATYDVMAFSPDGLHGVVFDDDAGAIYGKYTADGGLSWTNIAWMQPADTRIRQISWQDNLRAFAINRRGAVLHTTDGGRTWNLCADLAGRSFDLEWPGLAAVAGANGGYARYVLGSEGNLYLDTLNVIPPPECHPERATHAYAAEFMKTVYLLAYDSVRFAEVCSLRGADGKDFARPAGVLLDDEHLYVADEENNRVVKIDPHSGATVARFYDPSIEPHDIYRHDNTLYITGARKVGGGKECVVVVTDSGLTAPCVVAVPGCSGTITRLVEIAGTAYASTYEFGSHPSSRVIPFPIEALSDCRLEAGEIGADVHAVGDWQRAITIAKRSDDRLLTWEFPGRAGEECTLRVYNGGRREEEHVVRNIRGPAAQVVERKEGGYFIVVLEGSDRGIHEWHPGGSFPDSRFDVGGVFLTPRFVEEPPHPSGLRLEVTGAPAFGAEETIAITLAVYDSAGNGVPDMMIAAFDPTARLSDTVTTDSSGAVLYSIPPTATGRAGYFTFGGRLAGTNTIATHTFLASGRDTILMNDLFIMPEIKGYTFDFKDRVYSLAYFREVLVHLTDTMSDLLSRSPGIAGHRIGAMYVDSLFRPQWIWPDEASELSWQGAVVDAMALLQHETLAGIPDAIRARWRNMIGELETKSASCLIAKAHVVTPSSSLAVDSSVVAAAILDPRDSCRSLIYYRTLLDEFGAALTRFDVRTDSLDHLVVDSTSARLVLFDQQSDSAGVAAADIWLLMLAVHQSSGVPGNTSFGDDGPRILSLRAGDAGGKLFILAELPYTTEMRITIYNIAGQCVADISKGRHDAGRQFIIVPLDDLPAGLYTCVLSAGRRSVSAPFTIMK